MNVPATGLDTILWQPLVIAAFIYVILYVIGNVLDGRDDPRSETVRDISFGFALLMAAYTAVLAIMALVQKPELVGDMLLIIAIIAGFFALLVLFLYVLFELFLPRLRRSPRA